jgi:hypothetical protein
MRQYIVCLGLMTLLIVSSGIVAAQPTSLEPRRDLHGEWTLWQLADDQWYFRLTVGALANVYPKLLQPTGFARLTLGLSWAPNWLITPQIQITKAVHEITLSLEGVGNEPTWVIEFTPFVIDFEINPHPNQARAVSSTPASQQPTFALFREQVQRQTVKICTGLYISEDQKSEEVLSPLLTDVIKKLTFTNTKTGAKETFNLKESKCF